MDVVVHVVRVESEAGDVVDHLQPGGVGGLVRAQAHRVQPRLQELGDVQQEAAAVTRVMFRHVTRRHVCGV